MRRRPGWSIDPLRAAVIAAAALALAAAAPPAAAAATTRFASPLGSGSACTAASPCPITTALSGASSGSTVVLAGNEGTYGTPASPLMSQLTLGSEVSMQGAAGQPMPQIYSQGSGVFWAVRMEGGGGQRLSGVAIHLKGGAVAAIHANATVERVLALAPESTSGCDAGSAFILNSVCAGLNGIYNSVGGAGSHFELTLRNDTLIGTQKGMVLLEASAGQGHIGVFNTIVRGGATDIEAHQFDTSSIAIDLDHSNYASVKSEGGAAVTAAGSGANQTAAPLFANAASDDFRQAAGSPTIDAGANDAANGLLDLESNGRTLASRIPCPAITDIGAYELAGGPASCPRPVVVELRPVPTTSIVKAKIHKRSAKFRFEGAAGGEPLKFECKLDKKPFRPCTSPRTYKKLKPGKHKFSVRAIGISASDPTPAVRRFKIQAKA